MDFKASAEDASWTLREAAWNFEERFLWRGRDATRDATRDALRRGQGAIELAQRRAEPLQRLVQTRLTWPLADVMRERGAAAKAGIATAAVATAVTAAAAGAMVGGGGEHAPGHVSPPARIAGAPVIQAAASAQPALKGAVPEFEQGAKPPPPATTPTAPPAQVAWRFAQSFVRYEVGKVDAQTASVFAETADPTLANSLATSPPRLPAGTKVPEARVLNVVLADRTKKQVTASVSLVRLRSVSEVRLTLKQAADGWRVIQVLG